MTSPASLEQPPSTPWAAIVGAASLLVMLLVLGIVVGTSKPSATQGATAAGNRQDAQNGVSGTSGPDGSGPGGSTTSEAPAETGSSTTAPTKVFTIGPHTSAIEGVAAILGVTQSQVRQAINDGTPLVTLSKVPGVTAPALILALMERPHAVLEAQVRQGKITRAQADASNQRFLIRFTRMVNGAPAPAPAGAASKPRIGAGTGGGYLTPK